MIILGYLTPRKMVFFGPISSHCASYRPGGGQSPAREPSPGEEHRDAWGGCWGALRATRKGFPYRYFRHMCPIFQFPFRVDSHRYFQRYMIFSRNLPIDICSVYLSNSHSPYANHGVGTLTNICPNKITQLCVIYHTHPYTEHMG